jgi:homoserine kinase
MPSRSSIVPDEGIAVTVSLSPTALAITSALTGALVATSAMYLLTKQRQSRKDASESSKPLIPPGSPPPGAPTTPEEDILTSQAFLMPHNHEKKMARRVEIQANSGNYIDTADDGEDAIERDSVTVKVPGTSANMGPGFDCLGMAVDVWQTVTITRADEFSIVMIGEGAEDCPVDETNLLVTGVKAAFKTAGKEMPILSYRVDSAIPFARGLGSSSAAIVAGIIGGLVLAGHRLPCWGSESLLQIAAGIEGHPDNVASAIYGGIQLGIHDGNRWATERINNPPGVQAVLFIPDFIGKTSVARAALGDAITRKEACFNIGRMGFLVNALNQGNLDNLRPGVQDMLHQPQRASAIYTYLYPMIQAAQNSGACCAWLSGAGPTVCALTSGASGDIFSQREKERTDKAVANAMLEAAEAAGIKGKAVVTRIINTGARVVKVEPPFSNENIQYSSNEHDKV